MKMTELNYKDRMWTWANNREQEGFVEERLDRFFVSLDWIMAYPQAVVTYVHKQSSDHSLLFLDSTPREVKSKKRFYMDNRSLEKEVIVMEIERAWNKPQQGHPKYEVSARVKECKVALLKMKGSQFLNSALVIKNVKEEMESMQEQGGQRDWATWKHLKY